jgi:Flp pilus assembly protein TadG
VKLTRWTSWHTSFRTFPSILARNTRGAEIAETAMILPLLFMMLMAIFWFGQAYRMYGTITHAAREGARAAVAPVCATCAATSTTSGNTPTQNAINTVNSALTAASLTPSLVLAPTPAPPFNSCTTGLPVSCDGSVPSSNVCVQANVQLSTKTTDPGTCGTSVSFGYKYPYHFLIPLTTIDLGNITLPAQAQMRLETQ